MTVLSYTNLPPCSNPWSWQQQSKYGLVSESLFRTSDYLLQMVFGYLTSRLFRSVLNMAKPLAKEFLNIANNCPDE
jgi:hypothetical protein